MHPSHQDPPHAPRKDHHESPPCQYGQCSGVAPAHSSNSSTRSISSSGSGSGVGDGGPVGGGGCFTFSSKSAERLENHMVQVSPSTSLLYRRTTGLPTAASVAQHAGSHGIRAVVLAPRRTFSINTQLIHHMITGMQSTRVADGRRAHRQTSCLGRCRG